MNAISKWCEKVYSSGPAAFWSTKRISFTIGGESIAIIGKSGSGNLP